jgi:predicted GNAT family acetyltransferase
VSDAYTTELLTPETWADFAELVEANNGVWGGCWCMGFHPEGVGRAGQTPEGNRDAKRRHVERGTVHQVLVYGRGTCVGWCQFGSPAELPTIQNRAAYEREAGSPPDWRIGCIFTGSKHRGHGVARAAVAGALDAIRAAGGGVVEAYPEQTTDRPQQRGSYLHTGPEELYADFGFARDRKIAKWRWVLRAEL